MSEIVKFDDINEDEFDNTSSSYVPLTSGMYIASCIDFKMYDSKAEKQYKKILIFDFFINDDYKCSRVHVHGRKDDDEKRDKQYRGILKQTLEKLNVNTKDGVDFEELANLIVGVDVIVDVKSEKKDRYYNYSVESIFHISKAKNLKSQIMNYKEYKKTNSVKKESSSEDSSDKIPF